MVGQDADFARCSTGEKESRLARPDLALHSNNRYVQLRHAALPFALALGSQGDAEGQGLLRQIIKATDEEESLLWNMVELALAEPVEGLDGLLDRHR